MSVRLAEHGVALATVKVWPIDVGVRGKGGATANLDGVCVRRQRAAKPTKGSSLPRHLDKGRTSHGLATVALHRSGTNPDEAIRVLTLFVGAHAFYPVCTDASAR